MIGSALVRRLLADPAYEVRVADQRPAPLWMREGCAVRAGDLRDPEHARECVAGCTHVIHAAGVGGGIADLGHRPHTLIETNNALTGALVRAAIEHNIERFTYVSSSAVFERASVFPTPEEHLAHCPAPQLAYGISKLAGEAYCRAAHEQHGLPYTICRPFGPYGPGELPGAKPGIAHLVCDLIGKALSGERPVSIFGAGGQTRALTHVDDIAECVVTAMGSSAGRNEDFNVSGPEELTVLDIVRAVWAACGQPPDALAIQHLPSLPADVERRWPSVHKASELLGWQATVPLADGLAATVRWFAEQTHAPRAA
jgi:UDP-glucose 4-epimerase